MGDGLFAQMEGANTYYYNKFSLKLIEDALFELASSKLGMSERVFIMKTGQRGASQFHKAVRDLVSGWSMWQLNGDNLGVVKKVDSPLHDAALSAGFQFVEYRAPNGVTLKVEIDSMYDDEVRNKIMHPNGGPAYSYRYDIFDIGSMDQQNIFICKVKGQNEFRGIEAGMRDPWTGRTNNNSMSWDEDSATIHAMNTGVGVCVLDPTRTMSIIPDILQG